MRAAKSWRFNLGFDRRNRKTNYRANARARSGTDRRDEDGAAAPWTVCDPLTVTTLMRRWKSSDCQRGRNGPASSSTTCTGILDQISVDRIGIETAVNSAVAADLHIVWYAILASRPIISILHSRPEHWYREPEVTYRRSPSGTERYLVPVAPGPIGLAISVPPAVSV